MIINSEKLIKEHFINEATKSRLRKKEAYIVSAEKCNELFEHIHALGLDLYGKINFDQVPHSILSFNSSDEEVIRWSKKTLVGQDEYMVYVIMKEVEGFAFKTEFGIYNFDLIYNFPPRYGIACGASLVEGKLLLHPNHLFIIDGFTRLIATI